MKKIITSCFLAVFFALFNAGCGSSSSGGGGGSDWNSGSETNPTAVAVNSAGTEVATISPNLPVIGKASGLLKNGVYRVAMTDPNGTALYSENLTLVTDGDGNLADSILANLGNDAGNQAAASISKDVDGSTLYKVNYKAIVGGVYTVHICKSSVTTCDASTASTSTTVTVDGTKPYIFATDSLTGTDGVRSFLNGKGNVFAAIRNGTAGTTYGVRVIANSFESLTNGATLPSAASGSLGVVDCVANASGECTVQLWPLASATLVDEGAAFDIIADKNKTGTWETADDFMDAEGYVPGFVIQDATPPATAPSISKVSYNGTDNIADIACAAAGSAYCTHTNIFSSLDVYGWLNPVARSTNPHSLAYKYIILHSDSLADGDTLTPVQSFGYNNTVDPLQWGCTNEGRILLWPKATQVAGCYDVVMDVNKNGIYNSGVDIIDGYSGVCGFIIPGVSGGPTVTVNSMTDGAGTVVAGGGTTSTTTATLNVTVALGTGSSIASCQIRWASGSSSSSTDLCISTIGTGGTMDTQAINLFNGTNTIIITCVDNANQAGSATSTITSSNSATQNIHFQASLNWQKSGDSSYDMDLHLIEPGGTMNSSTDCYFANCQESSGGNTAMGAFLNVDCVSQCTGPENIWIPSANPVLDGTYKVCVHPFSGEGVNLQIGVYSASGSLIETVTRSVLNSTVGNWYVGNFNCTAATGSCSWSRVDSASATACP